MALATQITGLFTGGTTLTYGQAVTPGHTLLCATAGTNEVTAVSDSVNGNWTVVGAYTYQVPHWLTLWKFVGTAAGTPQVTINQASDIIIAEYPDGDVDQYTGTASGYDGGGNMTAGPTAALVASGEVVIGIATATSTSNDPFTAGSGFSMEIQGNGPGTGTYGWEDMTAASSAGQSMAMTAAQAVNFGAIVAVLKLPATSSKGSFMSFMVG
ncbi:MAG: hypothetical protein ABSD62_12430 [Candidatus Limnocylindrales bacterium]|jgi:hypothetical protein